MGLLDDISIFAVIVSQGGFSHAAKKLKLSNGLISRRLAKLESILGVTLLKRTTRQLQLTPEGELLWHHAKRIQQELTSALSVIHSLADQPTGNIRISATPYFGKHFLMPILNQFRDNFKNISIDLILTDSLLDPIKEKLDLLIRGAGFFDQRLKDSSMKIKLLMKMKINLYATPLYLMQHGVPETPDDLISHAMIGYASENSPQQAERWSYHYKKKQSNIRLTPAFNCNDMDSRVLACVASHGIGKFTQLIENNIIGSEQPLQKVLDQYDWGNFHIYAAYSLQHALPKRTRALLDFIVAKTQLLQEQIGKNK